MDALLSAMKEPALLVIVGPTGAGKSVLGLHLCRQYGGEIVNCDSMQIYQGMDIGTGKPEPAERSDIAHHMMDVVAPGCAFSAGDYARLTRKILANMRQSGRLPVVVGGTGLYLRALLEGLFEGPPRNDDLRMRLRAIIAQGGLDRLHRWLLRVDPEAGARIMPRDAPRIVRALEVYTLTGTSLSAHFVSGSNALTGFSILKLGLNPPREELYQTANQRVIQMLAKGWIDEVRALLAEGIAPDSQAFAALGYRQVVEHIHGRLGFEELAKSIQANTRHYAKRQWTWFRKDPAIHWLDGFGSDPDIQLAAAEWLSNTL
jgi:tRNA dimethylallyltransferase